MKHITSLQVAKDVLDLAVESQGRIDRALEWIEGERAAVLDRCGPDPDPDYDREVYAVIEVIDAIAGILRGEENPT
jgi:hypothetical protein